MRYEILDGSTNERLQRRKLEVWRNLLRQKFEKSWNFQDGGCHVCAEGRYIRTTTKCVVCTSAIGYVWGGKGGSGGTPKGEGHSEQPRWGKVAFRQLLADRRGEGRGGPNRALITPHSRLIIKDNLRFREIQIHSHINSTLNKSRNVLIPTRSPPGDGLKGWLTRIPPEGCWAGSGIYLPTQRTLVFLTVHTCNNCFQKKPTQ